MAASEVLKSVLGTKAGMAFATEYKENVADHFFQYLHPFKSSKKKVRRLLPNTKKQTSGIKMFELDPTYV